MIQVSHSGRRTWSNVGDWLPTVAPSRFREEAHKSYPKELEMADLIRIAEDYGKAAKRAKDGGMDGVELLASGHLIDQFWSPVWNKRSDEFGCSTMWYG